MVTWLPLAFTASWASGINPYLLVLLMGILGRLTDWDIPAGLERTDVLIIFAVLTVVDTVADKIMYLDSFWDAINTVVRPVAGGVVAALIAAPNTDIPTAAIAAGGGIVALVTHLAKASTRIAVNTSPEPVSNIALSTAEDVAVAGVVVVSVINPWVAAAIAAVLLTAGVVVAATVARYVRRGLRRIRGAGQPTGDVRQIGPE